MYRSKLVRMGSKPKGRTRVEIADEFGECERKMLLWRPPAPPVNPYTARHTELQTELLSLHPDLAGNEGAIVKGKLYQVAISARGFKSVITSAVQRAAFEIISQARAIDVFSIFRASIADMKTHCGAEFVKENIPKEQTGARTVSVVAIQSVQLKKAA
jgi:hypothetical protein